MAVASDGLELSESTRRRWMEALRSLAILLVVFAALYAVELTTFQLSIDDEYAALREDADIWIWQGRYTVYLIEHFLLRQPVVPFFPHAAFGVFIALAYLVVLRTHGVSRPKPFHYALFPMFAAFPTWFFLLEYLANIPSQGLAIFATSCAIAIFMPNLVPSRPGAGQRTRAAWWGRLALSAGLGAIALGAYQANLLLLLALGLGVILTDALSRQVTIRALARGVGSLGLLGSAATGMYALLLQLFRFSLDLEPTYLENFFQPEKLLAEPVHVIGATLREGAEVYGGAASVYGTHAFGFGLVVLLGLAAIVAVPSMRGRPLARVAVALLTLAILVMPLGLNFLRGGNVPYRALVAFPATVWLFGLLGLTIGGRWIARATLVAVAVATVQSQYVSSLFHAGAALVREHDRALAVSIHNRIEAVHPDFSRKGVHKVEFYGRVGFKTAFPQINGSTRARSFFEWDGGRPDRIVWYMRLIGFDHLRVVSQKEREKLTPILREMAIWPARGCVRVVGDVTLVRLGATPGLYHRPAWLRLPRPPPFSIGSDSAQRRDRRVR